MIKKLLTTVIFAASVTVAQAMPMDNGDPYPYSDDANQPPQAMQMVEDDVNYNESVRCWGWDGSKGGNDVKTMARGDCLSMHGTVDNQRIRARNNAIKKSL